MLFIIKKLPKKLLQMVTSTRYFGDKKKNILSSDYSQKRSGIFEDKIIIVTGGAEGIGFAVAKMMLKIGVKGLVLTDINQEKGLESISTLTCQFGDEKVLFVESDVSQAKQFDWVFKKAVQRFEKVDIVVNNAGVMNDVNWEGQLTTNLASAVIGTLLGMQYMSKTCLGCGGIIINIASIMGLIPSSGYPIHTMTQYGLVGFTRAIGNICHYERTGVKVIALCPGLTNTRLLKQAPYYAINEKFRREFKEESNGCVAQTPESVASGLIDIIERTISGSVWVIENNSKPYEIKFPEVADMRFKNKC